jgi:hypothetical protein
VAAAGEPPDAEHDERDEQQPAAEGVRPEPVAAAPAARAEVGEHEEQAADEPRSDYPSQHLLGVDAPVGVGEEEPTQAVEQESDAAEDREDDEAAADEEWVDAPAAGEARRDAREPAALVRTDGAVTADAVEELRDAGAPGRGRLVRRGRRRRGRLR